MKALRSALSYVIIAIASLLVVVIGTPLLVLLGRSVATPRGEMVVDAEVVEP